MSECTKTFGPRYPVLWHHPVAPCWALGYLDGLGALGKNGCSSMTPVSDGVSYTVLGGEEVGFTDGLGRPRFTGRGS